MEVVEKKSKETGKNRLYIGQLITSENYNNFTQPQRLFWQKCHKAFGEGKTFFKHKGQEFVVPFRLADDTFNSILTKDKYDNLLDKQKLEDAINDAGNSEGISPNPMA